MRVPESWLRQWVPTDASAEQMADALTMAGLEVESLEALAPAFTGVKVAFIESAERHPNADRLQVCQVRVNEGEPSRQIICGAPNARAGLWVACAVDGAVLPGDFRIKIAKMRGVESQGMLCSSKELGLSEESEGIVELNALQSLTLGQDLRDALGLDDKVLEIKLTPIAPTASRFGVLHESCQRYWPSLLPRSPSFNKVRCSRKCPSLLSHLVLLFATRHELRDLHCVGDSQAASFAVSMQASPLPPSFGSALSKLVNDPSPF